MNKSNKIQKISKLTQLIVFKKNQKIRDFKRCKVFVNTLTKKVILTPCNGDKDEKAIVLDIQERSFVQHETIFFILENESQSDSYILRFPKRNTSAKIFEIIQKMKRNTDDDIIINQQKCLDLLKQTNIDKNLIDTFMNPDKGKTSSTNEKQSERDERSRKRKLKDTNFGKKKRKIRKNFNRFPAYKIIRPPEYQVLKRNIRNKIIQKLVIFGINDRNLCYEYTWSEISKIFQCKKCQHTHKTHVYAKIIKNSLKGEHVLLGQNEHKCSLIEYVPENLSVKEVYSPNFQLEEFPHRNRKVGTTKQLTIFDSADKSIKYIYTYNSERKLYKCNGCAFKHKYVTAKIRHKKENNNEIYFELNKTEHVCKLLKKPVPIINAKKVYREVLKNQIFANVEQTSNDTDQQKKIELVLFDKNRYQGPCKLQINKLSKLLIIEPINEEFKMISASFDWHFFQHHNSLFVQADFDFKNFVLIFDTDKRCSKVYTSICKNKINDSRKEKRLLNKNILLPFVNEISKNGLFDARLKEIAKEWLQNSVKNVPINYTKILETSKYILVYSKKERIKHRRLIVFTSTEKNECFEYTAFTQLNIFYCLGCREKNRKITAKLFDNQEIKLCRNRHICAPKLFVKENYTQIKILKKPEYEIFEKFYEKGSNVMVIFDPLNRKLCYEFSDIGSHWWVCKGCKKLQAVLRNQDTEDEYVEIGDSPHQCEKQEFKPEKYSICKSYILSPNFETRSAIVKGNAETKYLIIFNENDRKYCYIYRYISNAKYYACRKCISQKIHVSAKLEKNNDGEEYVILDTKKHVCEMELYRTDEEKIIQAPDFEYLETTSTGLSKVIIFDSVDRKQCYAFSPVPEDKTNRFFCLGCRKLGKSSSIVQLRKNEDENYFIAMSIEKCRHICKPQKYDPEQFKVKKILDSLEYFFFCDKKQPKLVYAAIRHPIDKELCYKFLLYRTSHQFVCCGCEKKSKRIPKKVHQNEDGSPYFYESVDAHICKPIKVESLQGRGYTILKNDEISLTKKTRIKKQPTVKDKSKIVKASNFELLPNKNGLPDQRINIFHPNDRNLKWEYWMMNQSYRCHECCLLKKRNVFAKVYSKKNGEKYIILGDEPHICEPIQIKTKKKQIQNFQVIESTDEKEPAKLLIFTSPSKEFCYKMVYHKKCKRFQCFACFAINRIHVAAKILQNCDGTDYVEIVNNSHVCEPLKYIPEKPSLVQKPNCKIIPSSDFELHSNRNGVPNKSLIIFATEKKDLIYRYAARSETLFRCTACARKRHFISAKLYEDNENGQFLECSEKEHVCNPQKYIPNKVKK